MPITGIGYKNYRGTVWNLEVNSSRSFTTPVLCLHNCGDVMWLYIKIREDKKGNEIIKDISFETFGCIAALASSSIITELVKGKTIEQSLEITKDQVLDKLGGLPPIKVHCSVLAIDALHEAIYDFLQKNKRAIPDNLIKRHKTLEAERIQIEEKYSGWIQNEEKLHSKDG
ncbi:iron-sulfur cluster assembly scaffold protein [Patescibacteria group bacterium]|nr:iron-sulfur cluster assembly scaffold protein [Patescibacteria group bacterium]